MMVFHFSTKKSLMAFATIDSSTFSPRSSTKAGEIFSSAESSFFEDTIWGEGSEVSLSRSPELALGSESYEDLENDDPLDGVRSYLKKV